MKFKTSDAEMISLLVAPLYGNNPSIGIRELIQNSVDACNELIDFYEKTGNTIDLNDDINVTVKIDVLEDKTAVLHVTDAGIGMNLQIIENFFLNIGASFRNSDKWKELHETDGHSNVHRTGRFGVGLLAAFLLGDKIEVETRHIKDSRGLKFSCSQGSEDISIIPIDCPVGTKISILLSEETASKLIDSDMQSMWDWYCLSNPKVNRIININSTEQILTQKINVPENGADLNDEVWHRITHSDFDDIFWAAKNRELLTQIVCNGITLSQRGLNFRPATGNSFIDIEIITPDLVVYDADGKMPINLTRNGLTSDQLPFNEELVNDISNKLATEIYEEFYSKNLTLDTKLIDSLFNHNLKYTQRKWYNPEYPADLFYFNGKLYPSNRVILNNLKPNTVFVDAASSYDSVNALKCFNMLNANSAYAPYNLSRRSRSSKTQFIRNIIERNVYSKSIPCVGKRLFIKNNEISEILKPGSLPKSVWSKLSIEWSNDTWSLMKFGKVPTLQSKIEKIFENMKASQQTMFICLYADWDSEYSPPSHSIFSDVWDKVLGSNH